MSILTLGGNHLPWEKRNYALRYHHDGKHNVMTISEPFEIMLLTPMDVGDTNAVEHTLIRLVLNALDNNIIIGLGLGKVESRHIVDVIKLMYGVEFTWEVVLVDNTVTRLIKRIQHGINAATPFLVQKTRNRQPIKCGPVMSASTSGT